MERDTKPPTTSAPHVDDTLKAFYHNHKHNHSPSDDLFQRIYQTMPQPQPSEEIETQETPPSESFWTQLQRQWRWFLAPALVVACALFAVWQIPSNPTPNRTQEPRTFVPKSGQPSFKLLHAKYTPQGYLHKQTTRIGEKLQAGDGVQLSYQVPEAMHVMMISVNSQGAVSVFVPLGGQRSIQVAPGMGSLPRQTSLALDNYVGPERFFILFSKKMFATSVVKQKVQQAFQTAGQSLASMKLLLGPWKSQTLLIQKMPRK